jgi:SAM-dependent methyltransferase
MSFDNAKQRFSNRVADYARYRPTYPPALLDLLRSKTRLCPDHVVADIGSGTGLLSKLFLDNGNRVIGVEPNDGMRAGGEQFLHAYPNFTSVAGSAEQTTLAPQSVDYITVGQAFHWFDTAAANTEFLRILKPGGWVVVVWQDRRMDEKKFTAAYEGILERFGIEYKKVKDAYPETNKISKFFEGGSFHTAELPSHQTLDWESLCGRLRSSSFAPPETHPNHQPMMDALLKIFLEHEEHGRVRLEYFARIYYGTLDGDPR